jgi:phosphopentomutase
MESKKRVFLIVLDSAGAGELPDADLYGDAGSNTFLSLTKSAYLNIPNLTKLGLFNLPTLECGRAAAKPCGAYGYSAERSAGKDTIVGHWEIAGVRTKRAFPVYPEGFPDEVIRAFEKAVGTKVLCNRPYSGTEVIKDYGEEHIRTRYPIVYTSADSLFQIAFHTGVYPVPELYEMCEKARALLKGKHGVARVIARPFAGEPGKFYRTTDRRDYSLTPKTDTILDLVNAAGMDVISVGKIENVFSGRGITESHHTSGNAEGIECIKQLQKKDFCGLCFVNLVDFDQLYGHRNDIDGYAKAMTEFDKALDDVFANMREDDLYIVTADHGCDPATPSTDHSREYIPIICFGKRVKPGFFGRRSTFSDIGCTVCDYLGVPRPANGRPFLNKIIKPEVKK